MRKLLYPAFIIFLLLITGCSQEEHSPNERMKAYTDLWNKSSFDTMYDMLTTEAKETYPAEEFIDRYEKIYKDLEIKDLNITFTELTEKEEKKARDEGVATFTVEANMDSMAGPITFKENVDLHLKEIKKEDEKDYKDWYIQWSPNLIFPHLANGGKIRVETEQAKRGEILDRNLMPLAINDIAFLIGVVPSQFENEEKEKGQIAKLLNISVEAIDESLQAPWVEKEHFVPLKTIPSTANDQLNNLLAIPAVTSKETTGRMYPSGKAAAHLTGYIGKITEEEIKKYPEREYSTSDMIGKRGLEQLYEEQLHGTDGVKIIIEKQLEDEQTEEFVLAEKPVRHGEHVQIAIDVNIQERIFNAYDGKSGSAAAINPKTGEILALVSSPAFDPNELTYGVSQTRWDALMDDKGQPFLNRFTSTYAPGSVIKPVTAAIGLANETIKPNDGVTINGLTWGKKSWGSFKVKRVSTSEGPVDLRTALVRSDNIYFAMKAVEMGADKYIKGLQQFGLGEELPIVYPFPVSQISNSGNLKDEILLANTSYGQGEIELSTLHMALSYTPFLNEGNLMKPSFLADDPKNEVWVESIISKDDAELMQEYLREVVTDGTAKVAKNDQVAISGKTGTAELKLAHGTRGRENGWFVGYPTDEQDILIAMMMENVENVGSSSFVTAKVADILKSSY